MGIIIMKLEKPLITLLNNFCTNNKIELYLNNMYPLIKDDYLKAYLEVKRLNLKEELLELDIPKMKKYLKNNSLYEIYIKEKYRDYCKGKTLEHLCYSEKLICLQYSLENFKLEKEQVRVFIDEL